MGTDGLSDCPGAKMIRDVDGTGHITLQEYPSHSASRPAATAAHAQQGAYSLQASAAVVAASSGILLSVCVPLRIAKISNSDVYLRPPRLPPSRMCNYCAHQQVSAYERR